MSKSLLTILFVLFIVVSLVFIYSTTEKQPIPPFTENGTPTPTEENPDEELAPRDKTDEEIPIDTGADISDFIQVTFPEPNATVTSPVTVSGVARGMWYFEASFPIVIVDWDGRIIGEGYATAQDEWMTESFVPFEGTVAFDLPEDTPYRRGAIIFMRDNPSGLPEHDRALEIPVTF